MDKHKQLISFTHENYFKRKRRNDRLFYSSIYTAFFFFCILVIYPIYYVVMNSFNADIIYGTAFIWPERLGFSNYTFTFKDISVFRALLLSVLRVVIGCLVSISVNTMAAFALRKQALRFRTGYVIFFLIPLFFGGGLIPNFLLLQSIGLIDNFLVYILPTASNFFYVIILMSCFRDLSPYLEDSAHIDGAGPFLVYRKIFLPLSIPVIVTILLFAGTFHWNAWYDSIYYTRSKELETFAAYLIKIVRRAAMTDDMHEMFKDMMDTVSMQGVRFTVIVIAMLPVLLIYPFMQKYFVKGIRIGSVKG